MLLLVRHGRPLVDHDVAASAWELDPAGYDDIWALRDRLPKGATWFSSPEPKATQTAQLLTDGDVGIVDDLREQARGAGLLDDFAAVVRRGFAQPSRPAHPGWESIDDVRTRLLGAVRPILAALDDGEGDRDVVLVGHGTAWTVLAAALAGTAPDLDRWERLALPDVIEVRAPHLPRH